MAGRVDKDKKRLLAEVFGHQAFRNGQEAVVDRLLAGRSVMALFPTGGGKSLCYQLTALLLPGLTVVVSPLIALMKDQVEALQAKGVAAARLDSTLSPEEAESVCLDAVEGRLRLLYVAPERFASEGFQRRMRAVAIALLAVDEAHCISEWGHNFRPDYLKIAGAAQRLRIPRVLALTATATPAVVEDILAGFRIHREDFVSTGFSRPNLEYVVTPCSRTERDALLVEGLRHDEEEGWPAIVYVTLQFTAESVASMLRRAGVPARAYHAGMKDEHRAEVQDAFMTGAVPVVVATIAFGMGIDKADVRQVIHYNLPKSLENYVQESGRAGRDGEKARCEVLACGDDLVTLENFVFGDTPSASALKSLVEHLLCQGEVLFLSPHDLSLSRDMRPAVVATALAYLEQDGVIAEKGKSYHEVRIRWLRDFEEVLPGHDSRTQSLLWDVRRHAVERRGWHRVVPEEMAAQLGCEESWLRQQIRDWERLGEIVVKYGGVRRQYQRLADHPPATAAIARELVERFQMREQREIARLQEVVDWCAREDCLVQGLLSYFGEPSEPCGTCGVCRGTARAGSAMPGTAWSITIEEIQVIQELKRERHPALREPRQLARFLCGLSSPATTAARLHRDDRFGLMEHIPFQEVLHHLELS